MMTKEPKLAHDRLLSVLSYDPATGVFRWLKRISIRLSVGKEAGTLRADGYSEIGIDGERFLSHRLAWFYMTRRWPKHQIDHKDNVKANNSWDNLREATHGENVNNTPIRKNNVSGFKGVSFVRDTRLWHARIMHKGKLHLLGYFNSPEEANAVYVAKAKELHGEFARTF